MGERLLCTQEVSGSIPLSSTNPEKSLFRGLSGLFGLSRIRTAGGSLRGKHSPLIIRKEGELFEGKLWVSSRKSEIVSEVRLRYPPPLDSFPYNRNSLMVFDH